MKVQNILISQPQPIEWEKSPYFDISKRYNVNIDFFKFFKVESVSCKDFRKQKINILDHSCIIFSSKNAVDNFFNLTKELRVEMPDPMKYFCVSETTTYYLQKYIPFRKRKIFHGGEDINELIQTIKKFNDEKFLVPCSDAKNQDIITLLKANKIKHTKAVIYKNVSADLLKINLPKYQVLVLFSPAGVRSLMKNYPEYKQGEQIIAAFGTATHDAVVEAGLTLSIAPPTPTAPSMSKALDEFLKINNKRK